MATARTAASTQNVDHLKKAAHGRFTIVHFAGPVKYGIDGFFDKNVDGLSDCTKSMLAQSTMELIQILYPQKAKRSGGKNSIGMEFRNSLRSLIKEMDDTTPQFIKCIKPNWAKKPGIWENDLVEDQLRFGGMFSYLNLRRMGFDVQMKFDAFAIPNVYALRNEKDRNKIHSMIDSAKQHKAEWKKCTKSLIKLLYIEYDLKEGELQIGKTLVFSRHATYRIIEIAASFWVLSIQRRWREQNKERLAHMTKEMEADQLRMDAQRERAQRERERKEAEEKEDAAMHDQFDAIKQQFEAEEARQIAQMKREFDKQQIEIEEQMDKIKKEVMMEMADRKKEENQANDLQNEGAKQTLVLEIEALQKKKDEIENIIKTKIEKVKATKNAIAELGDAPADVSKHIIAKYREQKIQRDTFCIGSIGDVSVHGGTAFYISLNDLKYGWLGVLNFGTKLLLLSKRGYVNEIDDNKTSIRVMIVRTNNQKCLNQIGYVSLDATSYFTNRSVDDFM